MGQSGSSGVVLGMPRGLVKLVLDADGTLFKFILIRESREATHAAMKVGGAPEADVTKALMPKDLELFTTQGMNVSGRWLRGVSVLGSALLDVWR